jgi:DNA-binding NarL/FixJ family response regulator
MRDAIERALGCDGALSVVGSTGAYDQALAMARALAPSVAIVNVCGWPADGPGVVRELLAAIAGLHVLVITEDNGRPLLDAVAAGRVGYLSPRATADDVRTAVHAVHRGQHVVTPALTAELMRHAAARAAGDRRGGFTRPEQRLLKLMAEGATDRESGAQLGVSRRTVQRTLMRARRVAGVRRRSELSRWVAAQPFFDEL